MYYYYNINSVKVESDIPLWGKPAKCSHPKLRIQKKVFPRSNHLKKIWEEFFDGIIIQELLFDSVLKKLYYYAYDENGQSRFECLIEKNDIVTIGYNHNGISELEVVYFIYKKIPLSLQYMGYTVLHGASFLYKSKSIIVLGDSGVGKSTLSLFMASNGAILLSDDYVAIKDGMIHYTNSFSQIGEDMMNFLPSEFLHKNFCQILRNPLTEKYVVIPTFECSGVVPVESIYFLTRSEHGFSYIKEIASSKFFLELLRKSINGVVNPSIQFKEIAHLCSSKKAAWLGISIRPFDAEKILSILEQ